MMIGKTRSTPGPVAKRVARQDSQLPANSTKKRVSVTEQEKKASKDIKIGPGIQDTPEPKLEPLCPQRKSSMKVKETLKEPEEEKEKKPPFEFLTKKPGAKGGRSASYDDLPGLGGQ